MIKLLALDLDGTLLNSRGKLPDEIREAILAAEAAVPRNLEYQSFDRQGSQSRGQEGDRGSGYYSGRWVNFARSACTGTSASLVSAVITPSGDSDITNRDRSRFLRSSAIAALISSRRREYFSHNSREFSMISYVFGCCNVFNNLNDQKFVSMQTSVPKHGRSEGTRVYVSLHLVEKNNRQPDKPDCHLLL
jgi:hypothetical protein